MDAIIRAKALAINVPALQPSMCQKYQKQLKEGGEESDLRQKRNLDVSNMIQYQQAWYVEGLDQC